jgi:hypothetical protein
MLAGTVLAGVSGARVKANDENVASLRAGGSGRVAAAAQRKGRYKLEGGTCVWELNDSGPNQCNPRQPRKSSR